MAIDNELHGEPGSTTHSERLPEPQIYVHERIWLLAAAWAVAGVAVTVLAAQGPGGLLFAALCFPLGLFIFVIAWQPPVGLIVAIGWLACLVPTILSSFQGRYWRFFCIYAILCVLLIVNVFGWYVMVNAGWQD